ncbi:MAG: PAS domain S-box protein [Hydrogenophaga sp.]|uniref:PAS domain S-box protein n=1 Tax=Hydrogenophaga sp. TaxID=1904254 RepID=UPI0025C11CF8|nr:PAS domain S-box protein [Hydrogenophaga sp.]MBT9552002.1 PAS domain S-box protein [Hydrogenophaga sp.]
MIAPSPNPPVLKRLWQSLLDWEPRTQSGWRRFGAAIALTLLAAWLRMALAPAESGGRFITISLAVALSALYGGFAAGMVSTVLGMVLVNFFLVKPYAALAFDNPTEAFWLNLWHFLTQLVVVSAIALMQQKRRLWHEADEAVRLSTRQLEDTFEHSATGMAHSRLDGSWIRVNQTYCDLIGYTRQDMETMSFRDFTHPDDLGLDLDLLARTLSGEIDHYSIEKRYIHQKGHIVWVHLTLSLVRTPAGEPDYLIAVVQDVSDRKATEVALRVSEQLLRQAQRMARLAPWQADMITGRFSSLGDAPAFLGMPTTNYGADDLLALIHPEDRALVQRQWPLALKGRLRYDVEYRLLLGDEERWHSVQAEFERDAQGRAVRALGVTQDVTERKQAELEIQRLNASLEQRIQERTRDLKGAYDDLESYSYAVAHDLRSPLRIINGFAQALQEDHPSLDDACHGHLSRIMAASKKMGELIDGLLQLSQYTRGEVQRVPVNLSGVATRQLEELAAADPGRRVTWSIEPDIEIQADPALIDALMQNLLHNAWKYSAEVPDAHIRVFTQDTHGQRHYCVNDNGAGFDMARADKLFQPFQRLHQAHQFSGLGIGLATARRIVQRHGGSMRAQGTPGQGATFCFTLPDGAE